MTLARALRVRVAGRLLPQAGVRALLLALGALSVLGATVVIADLWFIAEGTWHAEHVWQVVVASGVLALGGRWSISVTFPVHFLGRVRMLQLATGTVQVPWNLLTAELLALAALGGARARERPPWFVAVVAGSLATLVAVASAHGVNAVGGIALALPGQVRGRFGASLAARPVGGWMAAITVVGVAVAAAVARWWSQARQRRPLPAVRLLMASALALAIAGGGAWAVLVAIGGVRALAHPLALTRADWFLGGPAWMVEGLGLGAGSALRVHAHLLTLRAEASVGLFPGPAAARWAAMVLGAYTIGAVALASRWYVRGAEPRHRALVRWLPPLYGALLVLWASGSAFDVHMRLAGAGGIAGRALVLLLRAVPLVGGPVAHSARLGIDAALARGMGFAWGTVVWRAGAGALVVSALGTAVGGLTSGGGPGPSARAATAGRERRVCALCGGVTDGDEALCRHCGARL